MIKVLISGNTKNTIRYLTNVLSESSDIDIVGSAVELSGLIELAARKKPDVILLDVNVSNSDSAATTKMILETASSHIILLSSSWDSEELEMTFQAMNFGALTVLERHDSSNPPVDEIIHTIERTSRVPLTEAKAKAHYPHNQLLNKDEFDLDHVEIVAIGASIGGVPVIKKILSSLPGNFPVPILVVQNISSGFITGFTEWLDKYSDLSIKVAEHGSQVEPSHVYIAPDDHHMGISSDGNIILSNDHLIDNSRPSISYLFNSTAKAFGKKAIGILLSGDGRDGIEGLKSIKDNGGVTIVQDLSTAKMHELVVSAIEFGAATKVFTPKMISKQLKVLIDEPDETNIHNKESFDTNTKAVTESNQNIGINNKDKVKITYGSHPDRKYRRNEKILENKQVGEESDYTWISSLFKKRNIIILSVMVAIIVGIISMIFLPRERSKESIKSYQNVNDKGDTKTSTDRNISSFTREGINESGRMNQNLVYEEKKHIDRNMNSLQERALPEAVPNPEKNNKDSSRRKNDKVVEYGRNSREAIKKNYNPRDFFNNNMNDSRRFRDLRDLQEEGAERPATEDTVDRNPTESINLGLTAANQDKKSDWGSGRKNKPGSMSNKDNPSDSGNLNYPGDKETGNKKYNSIQDRLKDALPNPSDRDKQREDKTDDKQSGAKNKGEVAQSGKDDKKSASEEKGAFHPDKSTGKKGDRLNEIITASEKHIPHKKILPQTTNGVEKREPNFGKEISVRMKSFEGIEFVWIPPGSLEISTLSPNEKECSGGYLQQSLRIEKGFWLGKYEVTKNQWLSVMKTKPWEIVEKRQVDYQTPVTNISWNDVQRFIYILNRGEKGPFRLPSEAEWEYACRSGRYSKFCFGEDIKKKNSRSKQDHNNRKAYSIGTLRVIRGGSWNDPPLNFKADYRFGLSQEKSSKNIGFRLARDN